ncbi:MAG: hypothetical protein V7K98_01940 [Nostoc sp.]
MRLIKHPAIISGWHRNELGKVELIVDKSSTQVQQSLTYPAAPKS